MLESGAYEKLFIGAFILSSSTMYKMYCICIYDDLFLGVFLILLFMTRR